MIKVLNGQRGTYPDERKDCGVIEYSGIEEGYFIGFIYQSPKSYLHPSL